MENQQGKVIMLIFRYPCWPFSSVDNQQKLEHPLRGFKTLEINVARTKLRVSGLREDLASTCIE